MKQKKYKIEISHQAGYVQIFQLWFEREGSLLPIGKMGRKTLGYMKEYCEELAGMGEEIDSPYIKYREIPKESS